MLLWKNRLADTPVMSLQTGASLGVATDPVIDPHSLQIVAFYLEGPYVESTPSVIHVEDIREFGDMGFIVDGSDSIMPVDDNLVRLSKIINYHFELVGMRVVDTDKHKLGKVINYMVEAETFSILKLSVKPPFLKGLQDQELVVGRQQIRKITDHEIVVAAPTLQEHKRSKVPQAKVGHFDNPFRKPQPEGAHSTKSN